MTPSEFASAMKLEEILPDRRTPTVEIGIADMCHPGLQFAGYFEVFAFERPQIIGKTEMAFFESLPRPVRNVRLQRYFSYPLPCIIIARGMECPDELKAHAGEHGVPIYRTQQETSSFSIQAIRYLSETLAPRMTCHGVLMNIFGVGILLTGESGIGKSECALELIKRGHALIADDAVEIAKVGSTLIGESPEMVRDFMELRGIGIVNIKSLFGIGALERRTQIHLVIHLSQWEANSSYDRLGSEKRTRNLMDVELPMIELPVRSGRNLAIIVETAARNWRLEQDGYSALKELEQRLDQQYVMGNNHTDR